METRTVTLTEFLLARIAEDEADAAEVARHLDRWHRETALNGPDGSQGSIVASLMEGGAFDPARVLAGCDAKRRIVEFAARDVDAGFEQQDAGVYARFVLGALALPYADHPDYDQEWRP